MSSDPRTPDSADGEASEKSGGSYCAGCHRSVAREDRVDRDGDVYHRQCAPDDVVDHVTLDDLETDSGRPAAGLGDPSEDELHRRARSAMIAAVAHCSRADVEPERVLEDVRDDLDSIGGGA